MFVESFIETFGNALEAMIGNIKRYEIQAFVAIAAIGAVVWAVYLFHRRKKRLFAVKNSANSAIAGH